MKKNYLTLPSAFCIDEAAEWFGEDAAGIIEQETKLINYDTTPAKQRRQDTARTWIKGQGCGVPQHKIKY